MFWLEELKTLFGAIIAAGVLATSIPASAGNLDLVTEGNVVETVFSDGLPNEIGKWQTKVQQVFDPKSLRVERRVYEYFDSAPGRKLDMVWYPQDARTDRSGRIAGVGRLVWRQRGSPAWDSAGVVSVFTGDMSNGRPEGMGELITKEGLVYEGAWRDGRPNGRGRLKLPSGEEYLGSFKNGAAEGKGREFDVTAETFEGVFRAGLRNGEGKTRLPSGFSYDSNWIRGVEAPWSRRIRLAQLGGPASLGGGDDVRMGVTVQEKPRLPRDVAFGEVVTYSSSTDGEIKVQPSDKKLMAVWKGNGELQTFPGSSTIRSGIFSFEERYIDAMPPTFLLEFQNRSAKQIQIVSLRLDVAESNTDTQPAVQMMDDADPSCGAAFTAAYNLENFGWSPAKAAKLHISFVSPANQVPAADGQIEKPIGDIAGRQEINFERELEKVGVKVTRLKELGEQRGFPCPSGGLRACLETIRSNPLFGTLGSKLKLNDSQIVVTSVGTLEYVWRDNKGADHKRTSPFKINVGLGKFVEMNECGEGSSPEPIRVAPLRLNLDAINYSLPVAFQRTIEAGKMARFTLPLDAAKSSDHGFRVVAKLADGREIASLPIRLLYYRPHQLPNVE